MSNGDLKNRILVKRGATTDTAPQPPVYTTETPNGLMPYELAWDKTKKLLYIGTEVEASRVIPVNSILYDDIFKITHEELEYMMKNLTKAYTNKEIGVEE